MRRKMTVAAMLAVCLMLCSCLTEKAAFTVRQTNFLTEKTTNNDVTSNNFKMMAETKQLRLELNPDTAVFRVVDKDNGRIWSSGDGKQNSQFTLSYSNATGNVNYMDSFADSVAKGQYRITEEDDGFTIQYSLGDIENNLLGPVMMSTSHYETVSANSSPKNRQILESLYYMADLDKMETDKRKKVIMQYPVLKNGPMYLLRNTTLSGSVKKQLDKVLTDGGYTAEMQALDEAFYKTAEEDNVPRFNVTIHYSLENDALRVRIPESEIFQYDNIPMETLNLLPYFGQPAQGDKGYYLLPDGSGSVMNFYNGKGDLQDYIVPVYGTNEDLLVDEKVQNTEQAVLPLFGCHTDDSGFLAVIDEGESMASVTASPGSNHKQPDVYAKFRITEKAQMDAIVTNSTSLNNAYYVLHEKNRYKGDIQVSYYFLNGENSDYSGMAARYREILFTNTPDHNTKEVPLVAELIGMIDVTENIAGISVKKDQLLTSFSDALKISKELKSNGVNGLSVRLSGYLEGGYRQSVLKSVKVDGNAGNASSLQSLTEALTKQGISSYLDADIQCAYKNRLLDGLNISHDVTRYLSKEIGKIYPYDLSNFQPDTSTRVNYVLKGSAIASCAAALERFTASWKLPGVSLRNVGQSIHADYTDNGGKSRQETMQDLYNASASLKGHTSLMLSGGEARFVSLADIIVELPMSNVGYDITDYSVPFTAMVYSNKIDYTGACANLEYGDINDYLRLIENGAGIYYRICAGDGTALQNTDFSQWFSIGYNTQKTNMLKQYAILSDALAGCTGSRLIHHRQVKSQVVCSTFESGWSIYINYNDYTVTLDNGKQIAAHSFYRVKEINK